MGTMPEGVLIAPRTPPMLMEDFEALLRRFGPRTCVDVATGRGDSLRAVAELFPSLDLAVGFDSARKALAAAAGSLDGPRPLMVAGDAAGPPFRPGSADLVTIVNSLHHFVAPAAAVARAAELMAAHGRMLVVEMYRDGQSGPPETHVMMHSWWGRIDRLNGIPHFETMTRAAIVRLLSGCGLRLEAWTDDRGAPASSCGGLPPGAEERQRLDAVIDAYSARIPADAPGAEELLAEGARLRRRAARIGFAPSAGLRLLLARDGA